MGAAGRASLEGFEACGIDQRIQRGWDKSHSTGFSGGAWQALAESLLT